MSKKECPFVVVNRSGFHKVRLVDDKDNFHEKITIDDALKMSTNSGLDLVCFTNSETEETPLFKLIDFGKWRYSQDKRKKKTARDNKHHVKEVKFTPVIGIHDIEHKVRHIKGMINDDCEIKIIMSLKGTHSYSLVNDKLEYILAQCQEFSNVINREKQPNAIIIKIAKKK